MPQNPAPPAVRSQLPRAQLPQEFQTLLGRLEQKYRAGLRVLSSDREWLEIQVQGVPLPRLRTELEAQKNVLLAGFADRMQLIHPLRPDASALHYHLLGAPSWADRARLAAFGG
jgi:hypothetical protein